MKHTHWTLILAANLLLSLLSCTEKPTSTTPSSGSGQTEMAAVGFDDNGASLALFSVAEQKYIRFSRGNLQYKPLTDTWRFATTQYSYIGPDNANISPIYNDWIDLFGWGTSGYPSGALAFSPCDTSPLFSDYYPGGNPENDLAGEHDSCDWGIYASITNGGNQKGLWRTLTTEEWQYLLSYGQHANHLRDGKWGLGTIAGLYPGIIILPDNWILPDNLTFTPGLSAGWYTNAYPIDAWIRMEKAGAIFLPAAGRRISTTPSFVDYYGDYWTSSHYDPERAYSLSFSNKFLDTDRTLDRSLGCAVRLVQDVQ